MQTLVADHLHGDDLPTEEPPPLLLPVDRQQQLELRHRSQAPTLLLRHVRAVLERSLDDESGIAEHPPALARTVYPGRVR